MSPVRRTLSFTRDDTPPDGFGVRGFNDFAGMSHPHAMTHVLHHRQVMRDEETGDAAVAHVLIARPAVPTRRDGRDVTVSTF